MMDFYFQMTPRQTFSAGGFSFCGDSFLFNPIENSIPALRCVLAGTSDVHYLKTNKTFAI